MRSLLIAIRGPAGKMAGLTICWGLGLAVSGLHAQAPRSATDEQMRPAFLYQLAQYVTWPEDKRRMGMAVRFCVLGNDVLAASLPQVLRGKTIQGRPVEARTLNSADELTGCHIAYVGLTQRKQLQELFAHWAYPPVVLVGETDGFAQMGGMVNMRMDAGRVSMDVNLENTQRARLGFRSQLLQLAHIVSSQGARP